MIDFQLWHELKETWQCDFHVFGMDRLISEVHTIEIGREKELYIKLWNYG